MPASLRPPLRRAARLARALAAAAGIVGALLALPAAAAPREALTIGITHYPATLHPGIDSMLAKSYVLGMTHRPITGYGLDWRLRCFLCETLPSFDNGLAVKTTVPDPDRPGQTRDGVDLTYTLREGLSWGDGTPVSTADVAFTWEVGRHPRAGVSNAELYRRIVKVTVKDARSFTLHVDKLTFDYAGINDFALLPAHLERPIFEAGPETYRNRTLYLTDPSRPGLWTGPYRVSKTTVGSAVELALHPSWRGEVVPQFKRITVRTIENTAALEANLLSGQLDMIAGELGLKIDQALGFEKRHASRFTVLTQAGLIYEHIDFNLDNPILADVRVRRALLAALDRQQMTMALFAGRQAPARSFLGPLDQALAEDLPVVGQDLAQAIGLLDAAGWPAGADGKRRNAQGQPLRLQLATTAGDRTRELVAQTLQSQWRQIGIEVDIRTEVPRVFFGETVTKRKYPGMAMFAWLSSPENVPRSTQHSTMIPAEANGWTGQNTGGWRNPEADRLIDQIEVTLDFEARKPLWRQLQQLYASELPSLPLYYRADAHVWPKWLSGITPTGHQNGSTLYVERWRAEEK